MSRFRREATTDTGFSFFVKEFAKKHSLYETCNTLQELAQPHWDRLSEIQRQAYEEKAVNSNNPDKATQDPDFKPNNHAKEEEIELERLIASRGHHQIRKNLLMFIQSAHVRGELHTTKFHFINALPAKEGTKCILPAEFGVATFTLKDGVMNDLCIDINQLSQPVTTDSCSEAIHALMKLNENLKQNYSPTEKFPRVFFTNGNLTDDYDTYKTNSDALYLLFHKSGEYSIADYVEVFPLSYLLYYMSYVMKPLKNISKDEWPEHPFYSLDVASKVIKRDMDKFKSYTMACDYHEEKFEVFKCSLFKVRASAFTFAKYCSDRNQYELFEGFHYPIGMRAEYETEPNDAAEKKSH